MQVCSVNNFANCARLSKVIDGTMTATALVVLLPVERVR